MIAMGKSKRTLYFLVEGETEKWYLEWLAEQLTAASDCFWADFRIGSHMAPDSFAKRMQPPLHSCVYTLLDFESTDPAHEARFFAQLREMRHTGARRGIDFRLGYANYAFELWLILHRMPFTRPVVHRKDYLRPINQAFGTSFQSMPNYKKEKNFRRLLRKISLSDVSEAISRAGQIRKRNEHNQCPLLTFEGYTYYRQDPSLSVDLLISDVLACFGLLGTDSAGDLHD